MNTTKYQQRNRQKGTKKKHNERQTKVSTMKKIEKEREKKRKKTILDENESTSTLSQEKSKR